MTASISITVSQDSGRVTVVVADTIYREAGGKWYVQLPWCHAGPFTKKSSAVDVARGLVSAKIKEEW